MSADNGVYILATLTDIPDVWEYRVGYGAAIDNIYEDNEDGWKYLHHTFGKSKVYATEEETIAPARELYNYWSGDGKWIIEYGITHVQLFRKFPT